DHGTLPEADKVMANDGAELVEMLTLAGHEAVAEIQKARGCGLRMSLAQFLADLDAVDPAHTVGERGQEIGLDGRTEVKRKPVLNVRNDVDPVAVLDERSKFWRKTVMVDAGR